MSGSKERTILSAALPSVRRGRVTTRPFDFGIRTEWLRRSPALAVADSTPAEAPAPLRLVGAGRVLAGTLAAFGEWTEVRNRAEGHFMETLAPGVFDSAIQDHSKVKVLYAHGEDPTVGQKPLGRITRLEETTVGIEYEVELFDVPYVNALLPGLQAGLFGASFLASDVRSERIRPLSRSARNPRAATPGHGHASSPTRTERNPRARPAERPTT